MMKWKTFNIRAILLILLSLFQNCLIIAQNTNDTLEGRNLYKPKPSMQDTIQNFTGEEANAQIITDSINARLEFIKDSIIMRENFVRDSIFARQKILDSLNFLKAELPRLLDVSLKIISDESIIFTDKLKIIGDSVLNNYNWILLPIALDKPYVPWKSSINLSDKPIKIDTDKTKNKITNIRSPYINCFFLYGADDNILRINEESAVLSNRSGKFFKSPFDSVFYNREGSVIKIKRYIQLNQVSNNYQKGPEILVYLTQVKQYEYGPDHMIKKYQVTNFCERWSLNDASKVCNIVNYSLSKNNKNYILTRNNDPANNFSDGTFIYEFENDFNLKSVSFNNQSKSEDWKCFIELNDAGNVSRYVYQNKGTVHRTLLINYFLNDPKAKNKVETITCTFEDDGISYYQKNNTTGQSRIRDKETGEWGLWK